MVQETVMSVIDQAMHDGILIGEERGLKKGEEKGKLKTKIETILIFLKNFPDLKNSEISILCKSEEKFVVNVCKAFEQDKEKVIKTFARDTFKSIPHMTEKDLLPTVVRTLR